MLALAHANLESITEKKSQKTVACQVDIEPYFTIYIHYDILTSYYTVFKLEYVYALPDDVSEHCYMGSKQCRP